MAYSNGNTKARTIGNFGKPSNGWLSKRLKTMADLRTAKFQPGTLEEMVKALNGFSEAILDQACGTIERQEPSQYRNAMPSLGEIIGLCQIVAKDLGTVKTRFCGRCVDGVVRSGKPKGDSDEFFFCECRCPNCDSSGVMVVRENGELWDARYHGSEPRFAARCTRGCRIPVVEFHQ